MAPFQHIRQTTMTSEPISTFSKNKGGFITAYIFGQVFNLISIPFLNIKFVCQLILIKFSYD
jgi:hypothetical protein